MFVLEREISFGSIFNEQVKSQSCISWVRLNAMLFSLKLDFVRTESLSNLNPLKKSRKILVSVPEG